MRNSIWILIATVLPLTLFSQTVYKGLPVIKATGKSANYRIGNKLYQERWIISPEISPDILIIRPQAESTNFVFYTDKDSIVCALKANASFQFYVLLGDTSYALTELKVVPYEVLQFDQGRRQSHFKSQYERNSNNEFLKTLREKYGLEGLIKNYKDDAEKALRILNWVHKQLQHNGTNEPKKNDALSILEEAKEGKAFRCVEYAIVTTSCLNAVGLKARTIALKTKNVETTQSGAGHVATEVFIKEMGKWVFLDGQWDVMPTLNGVPLNAVEFQEAIAKSYWKLEIKSLSNVDKASYTEWIYPYLYYLDIAFDNRITISGTDFQGKGKSRLMLVPIGAKAPTTFQINFKIDNCHYTNSLVDFYENPAE